MADIAELREYLLKNWFTNKIHAELAKEIAFEHFGGKMQLNFRWLSTDSTYPTITIDDFKTFLFKG